MPDSCVISRVACMLPEASAFPGWHEALASLWPDAVLVYTGRTELGIAGTGADE